MPPTSPNPPNNGSTNPALNATPAPISNGKGDRYVQLAALWGTDITDPSVQLLQEFDRQFIEMRSSNDRQVTEMHRVIDQLKSEVKDLKAETRDLKQENGQWRTLTSELLGMNRQQTTELKTLNGHIVTLATNCNNLNASLKSSGSSTTPLQHGLSEVQKGIQIIRDRIGNKNTYHNSETLFGAISHSEGEITSEVKARRLSSKAIQWTPLILALSIGFLCWFFGSRWGETTGALNAANRQFGGVDNFFYWSQVRQINVDRTGQCRKQGWTECPMRLP